MNDSENLRKKFSFVVEVACEPYHVAWWEQNSQQDEGLGFKTIWKLWLLYVFHFDKSAALLFLWHLVISSIPFPSPKLFLKTYL